MFDLFDDCEKRRQLKKELEEARQQIRKLEDVLITKDMTIKALEDQNKEFHITLNKMRESIESTPPDCKPGRYCSACDFGEDFELPRYMGRTYLCGKNGTCPNFVKKEGFR